MWHNYSIESPRNEFGGTLMFWTGLEENSVTKNLTEINLAVIGQARFYEHFDLPSLQRQSKYFFPRLSFVVNLLQRKRPRHFQNSIRTGRRRIERFEERNLLIPLFILLLLQRRFPSPRPRHRRRREGQESRLANGERLDLGSLGVAVLELERRAGEEVGDAGFSDDDGAFAVGSDDSVLDGLVVPGAAVEGFEGRIGQGFGGECRGSLGISRFFEWRRVFGDGNGWGRNGKGRVWKCVVVWGWCWRERGEEVEAW